MPAPSKNYSDLSQEQKKKLLELFADGVDVLTFINHDRDFPSKPVFYRWLREDQQFKSEIEPLRVKRRAARKKYTASIEPDLQRLKSEGWDTDFEIPQRLTFLSHTSDSPLFKYRLTWFMYHSSEFENGLSEFLRSAVDVYMKEKENTLSKPLPKSIDFDQE